MKKKKETEKKTRQHQASTDQRLEQALRIWEDRTFIHELLLKCIEGGPEAVSKDSIVHSFDESRRICIAQRKSVRQRLLHAVSDQPGPGLLQRGTLSEGDMMAHDPFLWGVFGWCGLSRRMYQVPGDLQLLLQATSLRGLWSDLKMPFEAFMLLLEEPLQGDDGESFDAILIHRYGEEAFPSYIISLLPASYQRYMPIPATMREQGERAMSRGDLGTMARIGGKWEKELPTKCPTAFYEPEPIEDASQEAVAMKAQTAVMVESLEQAMQHQMHDTPMNATAMLRALRLVFGFAHHVLTLPKEEREGGERPVNPPRFPIPKRITQGGHVCLIQSRYTLTREQRELFREYGRGNELVSAHFREGYYSRPPGFGSDPTAKRTVWHIPTIVRRDKLPEGTLPYGRAAVLKRL